MQRRVIAIAVLAACSTKSPPPAPPPALPPAPAPARAPGITQIPDYRPSSGLHLDEGGERHVDEPHLHAHPPHPIDITLRSTPPGAQVAVDGTVIGTTPTYWPGDADGHEHEFDFVLPGHAAARYRFVPITSGILHARLELVATEDTVSGSAAGGSEGSPLPGAGSALVNPPPAPVVPAGPADAAPADAAAAPVSPGSAVGPQP